MRTTQKAIFILLVLLAAIQNAPNAYALHANYEDYIGTIPTAGIETAARTSDSQLVGPRVLGGQRFVLSLGSRLIPIQKVSKGLFGSGGSSTAKTANLRIKVDGSDIRGLSRQINDFFAGRQSAVTGTIYLLGRNGRVKEARKFSGDYISEVQYHMFRPNPAGDGTTEHFFTVEFSEGRIATVGATSIKQTLQTSKERSLPSSVKFELGSFPGRVRSIEAIKIYKTHDSIEPTGIEFPNITITIPKQDAPPWKQWFHDFAINGKCAPEDGKITLLASDGREKLAVFRLSNVCPVSLEKAKGGRMYEAVLSAGGISVQ